MGVLNTQDNDRGTDETKGKECPDIDQFCNLLYRKATGGKCNADSDNDGRNVGGTKPGMDGCEDSFRQEAISGYGPEYPGLT